jgi:adenylate cyclase
MSNIADHHLEEAEDFWTDLLASGKNSTERRFRNLFAKLPHDPRCKLCNSPYQGIGAPLMRILGRTPSNLTPNLCKYCVQLTSQRQGGAEIELSMLFANVRGSTTLAESMSPTEFRQLINRFYQVSTKVFARSEALIDRLVGDQVVGYYLLGLAGSDHARKAIQAAQDILAATGHGHPDGLWLPVGAGVHTGTAFVGTVGTQDGVTDFTALGDAVNTAARLSSVAGAGELLISETAYLTAEVNVENLEERNLQLKCLTEPQKVRVIQV